MSNITLNPITGMVDAVLNLPGSKSIANRVLLLAALSNGISTIENVPDVSEDVRLMLAALVKLGIDIETVSTHDGASTYKVVGCNGSFPVKNAEIFCGNSGTTIRFLCAVLSLMGGNYVLTGIERMKERPIQDLVEALKQIGADVDYQESDGFPPLKIKPFRNNNNDKVIISGKASSQYITGLLMALPLLSQSMTIEIKDELISKPYVDITLSLLKLFSCNVSILEQIQDPRRAQATSTNVTRAGAWQQASSKRVWDTPVWDLNMNDYNIAYQYFISNQDLKLQSVNYVVEPDASSASYFLALGALNGSVTINNLSVTSLQGDKNFANVLSQMGAKVDYSSNAIKVSQGDLSGITINMEDMPDVAMTLAVVALFANGTTVINGIQSWKLKETDRLQAMYNELSKFGATVAITDSSITIIPPVILANGVAVDTYNDHRMAMCFSLIAAGGATVIINDYECVGKTFANYFDVFLSLPKIS